MKFDLKLPKCISPSLTKEQPQNCPQDYSYMENPLNTKMGHCILNTPECMNIFTKANENLCSLTGQCVTNGNE